MIRVLIVDDSPVACEHLKYILTLDESIDVVAIAKDGKTAIELAAQLKPNLITMDIHMPGIDGFEATRKIMETDPIPIIIVTGSWHPDEMATSFRAVEAGAVALVKRPVGPSHPDFDEEASNLIQMVKTVSEVRLVKRRRRNVIPVETVRVRTQTESVQMGDTTVQLIAMGASTGGPPVLQAILSELPRDFPAAVLIVQHIAPGFLSGFIGWLSNTSNLPITIAAQGEQIKSGHIYIAPDHFHMTVTATGQIQLTSNPPEYGVRPAVSYLFRSVAEYYGNRAVGVLLTGMGRDGAQELALMKEKGAVTIAQDEESSIVHGMPGEAIRLGAVSYVLSPFRIADALKKIVKNFPPQ